MSTDNLSDTRDRVRLTVKGLSMISLNGSETIAGLSGTDESEI